MSEEIGKDTGMDDGAKKGVKIEGDKEIVREVEELIDSFMKELERIGDISIEEFYDKEGCPEREDYSYRDELEHFFDNAPRKDPPYILGEKKGW